jgi:hypothetical protein
LEIFNLAKIFQKTGPTLPLEIQKLFISSAIEQYFVKVGLKIGEILTED